MRMLPAIIALYGLTLFGWPPCVAWSHAFPDHSEPKVGATLTAAPSRVRMWSMAPLNRPLAACTCKIQRGSGWIRGMAMSIRLTRRFSR
jgi:hypothetical protein